MNLRLPFLLLFLFLFAGLLACSDLEAPQKNRVVGVETQESASIAQGDYLYCLTNIGHTLRVFDLSTSQLLEQSQRSLDLDPVGPWFHANKGYYLSRVDSSGAGKNALVEFDPVSLQELRRFNFPANSNPSTLLLLPSENVALVTLKGSTFDDWNSNGIIRFDLKSWKQVTSLDLNDFANFQAEKRITSLSSLIYDASKQRVYALADNWYYSVRHGWLLVLDAQTLQILDAIQVGVNPQGNMLLNDSELWLVNNGGYADYGGKHGSLQILETQNFADGIVGNETSKLIEVSGDPTNIYRFSETKAWITTYPKDQIRIVNLNTHRLEVLDSTMQAFTGPLWTTSKDDLFVGMGGFGTASLGQLDTETGQLLRQIPLNAGNGGVHCTEHQVP